MKNKTYTVFIIDDHPLIFDAYKAALNYYSKRNESINFSIHAAKDCDEGLYLISKFSEEKKIVDLVFLDISIPPSKDGKILSGEDLGLKINSILPGTKIIVSTTFNDNYRVNSILKSLNPDGFLIKNDLTHKELLETINVVLNNPPYYSKTVLKLFRNQGANDLLLDDLDRKILYELSIGTRMKELPEVLPLSIGGIEKRKRRLKEIFNIKSGEDKELILVAKSKGFI